MMAVLAALAAVALLAWLFLLVGRGGFWRADQRLPAVRADAAPAIPVAAVVPARDEAGAVGLAVRSLVEQRYPGPVAVILVDDGSTDGTAEEARRAAAEAGAAQRLEVVEGAPLPDGWSGKLWAVRQGIERAAARMPEAEYLLLTDADVVHAPDNLRRLVAKAEAGRLDLVSLMVRLNCGTAIEKLLVPAFVFFFQKLYPFPRVNRPGDRTAAAAGGCMLVRRSALERAGGIAAIRGAIIDDCALARRIKDSGGAIWLGLAEDTRSVRRYPSLAGFWNMVARTAYTQLRHSPLLLAAAVIGMAVLYLVPPLALVAGLAAGNAFAATWGAVAWIVMAVAYVPTLRLYGLSALRAATLPLAALLFTLMTLDSARRHWQGRGPAWKGRTYGGAA